MTFNEQADALAKNWADAQKQAWDAWYEMASSATGARHRSAPFDPMAWLKQGISSWSSDGGALGGSTIDKLFSAQSNSAGAMDFLTRAWQLIAPSVEAGKAWQSDLNTMLTQWTEQLRAASSGLGQPGANFENPLESMLNAWPSALAPGLTMWRDALFSSQLGAGLMGNASPMDQMFQMGAKMHPAFAALGEMPRVGLTREKNAKFLRYADAVTELHRSAGNYQSEIIKGLSKAAERTIAKLAAMAEKGEKLTTVRELNRLWYQTADATFVDIFSTEEFIRIQDELTGAAMNLKTTQRDLIEIFLQALDIPTRTEIDDAYKTIYDLKKEVRQLKKMQAAAAATPVRSAPRAKRAAVAKKRPARTSR